MSWVRFPSPAPILSSDGRKRFVARFARCVVLLASLICRMIACVAAVRPTFARPILSQARSRRNAGAGRTCHCPRGLPPTGCPRALMLSGRNVGVRRHAFERDDAALHATIGPIGHDAPRGEHLQTIAFDLE